MGKTCRSKDFQKCVYFGTPYCIEQTEKLVTHFFVAMMLWGGGVFGIRMPQCRTTSEVTREVPHIPPSPAFFAHVDTTYPFFMKLLPYNCER